MTLALYQDNSEFIGPTILVSPVITIIASEELIGKLTIIFLLTDQSERGNFNCISYTDNSEWTSDGISTTETENTIECTTNHLTTFSVTLITINKNVNCSDPVSRTTSYYCNIINVSCISCLTQQV
eukprot:TRINITY_DN5169_c0_g1_i2.p1 TRINITY_DN5169_c0_g1~~TRINITY_DN5169_c0_g1_i2.p1  ORF type:complete len:126 (-),score=16.66 TRINITY_DN5169_c0_g1_i2:443-820(-)